MQNPRPGTVQLFQVRGISIFLHWSWLFVAVVEIQLRRQNYRSLAWNIAEYVALFAIVLLHELGHAFACRSVGGLADHIILWPLGGIAYVRPPPRPGALLWSVAAGPLVNLVLLPICVVAWHLTNGVVSHDLSRFFLALAYINGGLFIFNCLPVYPLDGGQILRALLWFVVGRARSLLVASTIGLFGAAAVMAVALFYRQVWPAILAVFGGLRAWAGMRQARALSVLLSAPVRAEFRCPACLNSPPQGPYWRCGCGQIFDRFASPICPACFAINSPLICPHCGEDNPVERWSPRESP
ncbi:MAG: site-2 protease family protein [Polyangiaceae bacterium]